MVMSSRPSLRTVATIAPGSRVTRWNVKRSTGGVFAARTASAGRDRTMTTSSAARIASGTRAIAQFLAVTLHRPEKSHPAKLGELALMRMEHEVAGIPEGGFDDRPFTLTEHQRVGALVRRE